MSQNGTVDTLAINRLDGSVQYFANLDVWRRARRLVVDVYRVTATLPEAERFGLISQMRGAAVSIPANVAEGAGRSGRRDFARFLDVAVGSASEIESHLMVCTALGLVSPDESEALCQEIVAIRGMLRGLRRRVLAGSSDS